MTMPTEDALVAEIMASVKTLLDGLLDSDGADIAAVLAPGSFADVGVQLFGLDALAVPMGFAARPHHLGLTTILGNGDRMVAEIRGFSEQDEPVSVCSVFLAPSEGAWQVEDIWPVAGDGDLEIDEIVEPTVQFYSGALQLPLREDAVLDAVETLLIPGLQEWGLGLHLIERGIHLWRAFSAGQDIEEHTAAAWAAGLHLALVILDSQQADPVMMAEEYGVETDAVAACFMEIATLLGFDTGADPAAPRPAHRPEPPPILGLDGQPLTGPRRQQGSDGLRRSPGGLILPDA